MPARSAFGSFLVAAAAAAALAACSRPTQSPTPTVASGSAAGSAAPAPAPGPGGIALPEVGGAGLPAPGPGAMIVVTPRALVVDGRDVVALVDGTVDAADKEGGALGMRIPALAATLAAVAGVATGPDASVVYVAADPSVPYLTFFQVLYTAKQTHPRPALIVRRGARALALPFTLPSAAGAAGMDRGAMMTSGGDRAGRAGTAPPEEPLGLIISVTKTEAMLWSMSGQAGTIQAPAVKVALADRAKLGPALADIVAKRWGTAARPAGADQIILQFDPSTAMQIVAEVADLARATADGTPLFPAEVLSAGFE